MMLKSELENNNEHILEFDQLQSFTFVTYPKKENFYSC